jgi:hypothetical protein
MSARRLSLSAETREKPDHSCFSEGVLYFAYNDYLLSSYYVFLQGGLSAAERRVDRLSIPLTGSPEAQAVTLTFTTLTGRPEAVRDLTPNKA